MDIAIVEQVRDGSSIRVRLLLEDGSHQFINLVNTVFQGPINLVKTLKPATLTVVSRC